MHIVIVGCGRVGSGLAVDLLKNGHSVTIIDKASTSFRRLPEGFTGEKVVGFGFDIDDLKRAGAERAFALAAVTSGDNSNILTARIARENFNIKNVVARIYDPRRAEIYQRLGIPTVATVSWTIDQVHRRLFPDTFTDEWTDATGSVRLIERMIDAKLSGVGLKDFEIPGVSKIVMVMRGKESIIPSEEMIGQEGDVLYVAVKKSGLESFMNLFGENELSETGN